jgi:hypothetical protein
MMDISSRTTTISIMVKPEGLFTAGPRKWRMFVPFAGREPGKGIADGLFIQ